MTVVAALVARLPLDVPVVLGRDEAARLARLELARPEYGGNGEPWTQRVMRWLLDRIASLLDTVGSSSPLGWFGLLGIAVLGLVVVVAVRRRIGRLARGRSGEELFATRDRTSAQLRVEAERLAGAGAWAEAVRARLRAIVRDLEDRGLVDARPGRTADEIARDAGRALATVADDLLAGARLFDDVWYGGRPAGPAAYERMQALDDAVAAARPAPSAVTVSASPALPR